MFGEFAGESYPNAIGKSQTDIDTGMGHQVFY